jgi:hypothetical protein
MRAIVSSVASFVERVLRESTAVSAFCLVIVWITYFVGILDRETLLIGNGVLIALMVIAALLKHKNSRDDTLARGRRQVRRPFPTGAILRSGSHPDVTQEDRHIIERIRTLYVTRLMDSCTQSKPFTVECPSCVICLVDYDPEEQAQTLACGHAFHSNCLMEVCHRSASRFISFLVVLCTVEHTRCCHDMSLVSNGINIGRIIHAKLHDGSLLP